MKQIHRSVSNNYHVDWHGQGLVNLSGELLQAVNFLPFTKPKQIHKEYAWGHCSLCRWKLMSTTMH